MYLTQKNHLRVDKKTYKLLRILTHLSKDLYNLTLYVTRQHYELNGIFLPYARAYHLLKNSIPYKLLPSQAAQQTMKIVERNYRSFFRLLKERKKGNYNRPIRPPKFLPKDGHFLLIFPYQSFKVKEDKVILTLGRNFAKKFGVMHLEIPLPKNVKGHRIKEIRILPKYNALWFEVEYVYEVEPEKKGLDYSKYLAIDLGVDNFATCVSTTGTAFVVEGRWLKSFNQWWNKKKAKLQSQYDKQGVKFGRRMARLLRKRKNVMNNFMNQAVNYIIKYCLENKIGSIVIGKLEEAKQRISLGKVNNQNFQFIPYGLFKRKLKAKCERYGINFIEVDEAYTSKVDALALEPLEKKEKYWGKRVKRGLFQSSTGVLINADVNGALNILRKVAGDSLVGGIVGSGRVNRPVRVRLPATGRRMNSHKAPSIRAGQFTSFEGLYFRYSSVMSIEKVKN
ncbi:RNA-guided endonuclease InsQ/TnpB family protein [Thermococcus argininiproducens]|uniref:RNA-guided endonuclease InsQ/TnpB family protein n=1 Tax=Thermococcus argininiproducens TaxID=2866384 RepID=UPI002074745E|nr:transposase [Thermococcus argininiproducens]